MIRFFATHPTAANLLMIAFIVIGLAAAPSVKRETFPDIPPDQITVRAVYPGASALEVESAICERIEDAVESISEINEVRCDSQENVGTAIIKMREGSDIDRFLGDIKTEVEAIDSFPESVEPPVISQNGRTDFVVSVAVAGPMSPAHLKAYAEQLKNQMLQISAISQVTIRGFSDHQIRIEIPALALRQSGLSIADIADVISRQSIDLPAGAIEQFERNTLIRFADERRSIEQFSDLIVISGKSGSEIRLGDIATITDRFELDEEKIIFNGQRAAILEITKTKTEDTLVVVDAISDFVEQQRQIVPPGVEFELTQNISTIVRDRLNMLLYNGMQGLFLVFLTMWLFFSFRFSFWVAMGLPISFLGTIFMMSVLGYSFDMITMVGLLIAVGLLMDDAIVLSENIASHLAEGQSITEAAITGTRQVAPGVIASYITTVCIFGSLMFLQGTIGNILKVLPIILIATLSVSLVEAFLILPHHLAHARKNHVGVQPSTFRQGFEERLDWVRQRIVGRLVDKAVEWRYLSIGLMVGFFLLSISIVAGGGLKFLAFPDIDGNLIEARVLLPQGTPLSRTEATVDRISTALKRIDAEFSPDQPGGQALVKNINIRYGTNRDANETGPHVATISVDLLDAEIRTVSLLQILKRWRQESGTLDDVLAVNFVEYAHGPAGRAIDLRLHGDDLQELKSVSLALQGWINTYEGVLDLHDDLRPGKPEIRLQLSAGALSLGLDASTIASQLRAAFFGRTVSEIQVGSEALEIDVRLAALDRDSLADLEYFTLTTKSGRQVPLATVATLQRDRGWARIARVDGRRTLTIQGDVDARVTNVAEIIRDTRSRFLDNLLTEHPGVSISYEGQVKEGATTGKSIIKGFGLGLIGVFLLLCFLFKSYIEPIIVMSIIPLGLIGVIWGHLLMGLDLSMPSIIGYASLAGVVVNDSILLVHFIKIRRAEGKSSVDAAQTASRERFRAVLLTSLTTIAGLLPLMLEQSLQAQILIPLVTSLSFGLLASTGLVLIVVPVLYAIFDDFGWTVDINEGNSEVIVGQAV
ncbi:MAG: efflux RND transporter permease subunit [Rhodospirillaceae bacterium]|jgi:hydrophobic/amphiphilic exporter-1 (mainly G- bacteria), HAE1 family|nr:efflux RND transporter permease subunit [Rhodospirillaceae bacterium]MBT5244617.1 efflux RND transporter permease subunit [Rhodospirillaceae bacterium]MBT5563527.1 efflux RND transporter permease subunit [Rhodospirillaceae bacterium]MBT6240742.1 efflux RND transporter permease subunit [Rhodospirillaceae bacterium]MBT7137748.1 efflux RND transporter permease subunit [Rhodospirillaceae bacterium]